MPTDDCACADSQLVRLAFLYIISLKILKMSLQGKHCPEESLERLGVDSEDVCQGRGGSGTQTTLFALTTPLLLPPGAQGCAAVCR